MKWKKVNKCPKWWAEIDGKHVATIHLFEGEMLCWVGLNGDLRQVTYPKCPLKLRDAKAFAEIAFRDLCDNMGLAR